jgi:Holliday junction DNA helicase RuvA
MIGRITGTVIAQETDGVVVVDVNGVGYELLVPLGTVGRVDQGDGRATFFVHTHVREDQLSLFGFASDGERFAFRTLIGVSSVGPKTAVAILGALPAAELARAIATKDLSKLTSVPGIGKKIAERLVLELRDKLSEAASSPAAPARPTQKKGNELLLGALTNMGYRPAEAERAVAQLEGKSELPLPELIREALAILAK